MKRNKLFFVILTVLAIVCVFVACNKDAQYTLGKKDGMSFTLAVGADNVDFTQYFSITNKQGDSIAVTEDMLDLSQVDTSKPGTFNVGLSYKGYHFTATFTVQSQNVNGADLSAVFNKYNSYEKWNFEVDYKVDVANIPQWDYIYGFMGDNFSMSYDYDGQTFTDYIEYVASTGKLVYYADLGDGTHDVINEDDDAFDQYYMYVDYLELCNLNNFAFEDKGAYYSAMDIQAVGNEILGEYQDNTWTQVDLYIQNGEIVKIIASADALDDSNNAVEYEYTIVFSNHGNVEFDLSALKINQGGGDDVKADYTTTFISAALGVGSGELEYTSNVGANSLDANRGLQFMQANGEAVLTSKLELTGVTQVSVIVATNQDLGMLVSVCVGGVQMTSGGQTSVKVEKSASFTEMTTLTFVSSASLNGSVEITLTNTATKKSMYIKTITVSCGSTGGEVSRPVMEKQIYDAATFDRSNLQDRIEKLGDAIGLPSTGTYDCLVVPVQFAGTTISQNDLARLDKALNGTQADTGWESVKTYYQKSSYGQLNMNFDIQDVYVSQNNATYYKNYTSSQDQNSQDQNVDGSTIILIEVLTYLEPLIDLDKYDTNNDGVIDAVYLIYSAPVSYEQEENFYWAYVTWYLGEQKFDGLDAYYYLFAGFDFMNESTGSNDNSGASQIDGLSINASTYIHETGHLLGLDDYYDGDESIGSGEGLGGADMMDATVGDQSAYSKLMLGWVEPAQIVTQTATVTINSFVDSGQFILIPLSFDNTYFCEYLIIDLYSATGLNALHAAQSNSYLYDGISCGVRIYHVSTELINNLDDYDGNSYWSYTKYNNSDSQYSLIKLVEADGDKKFSSTNGWAADQDLWQTGDTLSSIQPNYTRNDGKLLNFDITIDSVSATSATITITYSAEE